jgi:hypothetical protein
VKGAASETAAAAEKIVVILGLFPIGGFITWVFTR